MNKLCHLSIPVLTATLILVAGLLFVQANSRAVAANASSSSQSLAGLFVVTTLADDLVPNGECSLREALEAANTNTTVTDCGKGDVLTDTITFDVAGTITLTSQLSVTAGGPLVIDGSEVITTSGGNTTRVWWIENNAVLIFKNISVVNGYISGGSGAGLYSQGTLRVVHSRFSGNRAADSSGCGGGAIHQQGGHLTVRDSLITNNSAICEAAWGGGIVNQFGTAVVVSSTLSGNVSLLGGAILNFGTMSVTNSTLYNNIAYHEGGAIHNYFGTLTLLDSTLTENTAEYSGALHNGWGSVTAIGSTLNGNHANWGGGIMNQGLLTVTNTTFSANSSVAIGGGIYNTYSGTLTMTNSTLSGNESVNGGALYNENLTDTVFVVNSILANSRMSSDCWGSLTDGGHNISSDDTCSLQVANDSLPDTDPLLKLLLDYGGPTWTHALQPNSPALDAADDTHCPIMDQRGVSRPQDGDNDGVPQCDIGSYEAQIQDFSPNVVTILGPNEGTINDTYIFTAVVEPIITALPLTYTWQVNSQPPFTHTSGLTDTTSFKWDSPGVYRLNVSAENLWGVVTDTHSITITDIPITGLVADNDSPALLGEVTTLNATVAGGTNVVYTWDFGDGETGSGQVVTHTYDHPGVYTAIVTASNSANSLSTSTQVIILEPTYWQFLPFIIKNDPLGP